MIRQAGAIAPAGKITVDKHGHRSRGHDGRRRRAGAGLDVRIGQELIDQARAQGVSRVGPGGLLSHVTRTVLQTGLEAEMTEHLGYEKGDPRGRGRGNHRNGSSPKTVQTEVGPVQLDIPRDRAGGFEPQIVPKHARRVEGFDEAIISLYAKGLTTGEIQAHLADVYQAEVSRDLISRVTDKVVEELATWQSRPLDRRRFLLIDALMVKKGAAHGLHRGHDRGGRAVLRRVRAGLG